MYLCIQCNTQTYFCIIESVWFPKYWVQNFPVRFFKWTARLKSTFQANLDTVVSKEDPHSWWVPFHSTQVNSQYMYRCVQKNLGYNTGTYSTVSVTHLLKWRSGLNFLTKKRLRQMDILFILNCCFWFSVQMFQEGM